MARTGGNPDIADAGKNTRFGTDGGYSAVKAQEKSVEARAINTSLSADLKGRCTPDRLAKINERILSMAEKGNLKAYELVRDTIGEKPVNRQINENIDRSAEELNEYLGRQESPND